MTKENFNQHRIFKSVFILGGNSEIAQEICIELTKKGTKKFHLILRTAKKIESFIKEMNFKYGVKITIEEYDLLKGDLKVKPSIDFFDLYIIASGYLGDSKIANNDLNEALDIARVNYYSLIPWISKITSESRISKHGALWVLSSVAGDIGRPSNYHYGAAKAALTIFCEGILLRCQNKPFKVRIIKAGLINTAMSRGKSPKFMYAKKNNLAKSLIKNATKEGIEYWPWWWRVIINFVSILPRFILSKL